MATPDAHHGQWGMRAAASGLDVDAPRHRRRRAHLLGEEAADPAHGHAQGDGGGEQVAGGPPVAEDALGDEGAHVGARQPAEDALAPVGEGAHDARVGGGVDVAPQGAEPGPDGPAEQGAGHDPAHGLVEPPPPAALHQEHGPGREQPEGDEEGVGGHSDGADVEEDGPHASETLRSRSPPTADTARTANW